MSDILIRGMDMPKDIEPGLTIEFADGIDGKRYARLYHYQHGGLTEWCEAVSIPPMWRLIDADKQDAQIEALIERHLHGYTKSTWDFVCELRDILKRNRTIIPAEPSEEQMEYEAQVEATQYCEMYESSYDPETGAL